MSYQCFTVFQNLNLLKWKASDSSGFFFFLNLSIKAKHLSTHSFFKSHNQKKQYIFRDIYVCTLQHDMIANLTKNIAQKYKITILYYMCIFQNIDHTICVSVPQDGVFIRGLYLEGAGWDKKNSCLVEAEPMQLVCPMPTTHFRPVENRKKTAKGIYPHTHTHAPLFLFLKHISTWFNCKKKKKKKLL